MMSIIEHVLLFKLKETATQSEIDSMLDRVNSLSSLQESLHLSMTPLLSIQSSSSLSSFNFTHILHIRFRSKEDLQAYAVHPTHVAAIKDNLHLVDDIMALDWVTEMNDSDVVLPIGSASRVVFFKLKEGVREECKDDVLRGINGIQREKIVHFNCGKNFSLGRNKEFSIGSLAVFSDLSELQKVDSDEEIRNYHINDQIKNNLDTLLLVDFVAERQTMS